MGTAYRASGHAEPAAAGRPRSGAAAVEFALLLPVLLMLLVGIIDVSRLLWARSILAFAVEEAARCAAVDANACATAPQTQAHAAAAVVGLSISPTAFLVSEASCGAQVSTTYTFDPVLPWLFDPPPTFTVKACFPR